MAEPKIRTLDHHGDDRRPPRLAVDHEPALKFELLEGTGRFDVRVTEEFRGVDRPPPWAYDLVFSTTTDVPTRGGTSRRPLRSGDGSGVVRFRRRGKGLIAYHPTLAGGVGWDPQYERLLGGVMRGETSRRAPNNDFMLHVGRAASDHH